MNNDQNNNYNNYYTNGENDCFYNFDSFVDPNMLLPAEVDLDALTSADFAAMNSIPALPSEIPPVNSGKGPGSLYDKLTTTTGPNTVPGSPTMMMSPIPGSPTLYPYGSPYSMGSPSSLMMTSAAAANDVSWMHSNRPRRRRSAYSSPSSMMTQTPASPYLNAYAYSNFMLPYANPMMMNAAFPHHAASYMMAPPMSPMNVTVKLPMVPLTPTSQSNENVGGSLKIPLVLPCHLQQERFQNTAAPNVSKLQTCSTVSSGVPSRCSSIAPNSSISSRSAAFSHQKQQNWFTEMSATKNLFLKDVDAIDLTNVTVLELKQILRRFGLNSTGKKAQLVERIMEISNYLKSEGRKRVKLDKNESSASASSETETIISHASSCIISAAV